MTEPLTQLLLFLIAFVANTFSALAGGGAGLIQFPALIFLGLSFQLALATHKVASVALGLGATLRHAREDALERNFALYILACGIPGVIFGSVLAISIPARAGEIALGLLTLGLGIYSMLSPGLGQGTETQTRTARRLLAGGAGLFVIGALNGALTSGTGLFVTMLLVRVFGLDYKRAVAYTLVLVGLFWNGSGAVTLIWLAEVQWSWIPALLAGSLLGGYLGAHLAIVKGNRLIKRSYELVSVLIGLRLMLA
jgi:uncharacterized membrane protein YfcA